VSRGDDILARLVALTRNTGPGFVLAWSRLGPDSFPLSATGETFTKVWASAVLQQVHPGADIDELLPAPPEAPEPPAPRAVTSTPPRPVSPAGNLTPAQWRSIREAEAADTRRRR
jgi:hypothetical protein